MFDALKEVIKAHNPTPVQKWIWLRENGYIKFEVIK
jgi:hypothetical protein